MQSSGSRPPRSYRAASDIERWSPIEVVGLQLDIVSLGSDARDPLESVTGFAASESSGFDTGMR